MREFQNNREGKNHGAKHHDHVQTRPLLTVILKCLSPPEPRWAVGGCPGWYALTELVGWLQHGARRDGIPGSQNWSLIPSPVGGERAWKVFGQPFRTTTSRALKKPTTLRHPCFGLPSTLHQRPNLALVCSGHHGAGQKDWANGSLLFAFVHQWACRFRFT